MMCRFSFDTGPKTLSEGILRRIGNLRVTGKTEEGTTLVAVTIAPEQPLGNHI